MTFGSAVTGGRCCPDCFSSGLRAAEPKDRGGRTLAEGRYRPDIDGLRTLAVLPVVLFHAGMPGVTGGYVGVDVFFVISGYLIAGILLNELDGGTYSIVRFYERRIRRIFPALAVVVAATLAAGTILLAPSALADVGTSALAVGAFCSNFFFWRTVNYFDAGHTLQPLLHTWSLSVEEQFYIIFPPLLSFLTRRRWPVVPVMALGAVASFMVAAGLVFVKPSAAFYLPFTRAWELLAGALLAAGVGGIPASRHVRAVAGMAGLALIIAPIVFYTAGTPFPGAAALPPVLGSVLVIWSGVGGGEDHPAKRLLATAPMVGIGRISYSLYLWHVPLFTYAAYVWGGIMPAKVAASATLAAMLLAWASYRWVERPFRADVRRGPTRPVLVGSMAMLIVVAGAGALVATRGWPDRLDGRSRMLVNVIADKSRFHVECLSVGEKIVTPVNACLLGNRAAAPHVLLWGDSHSMVTASAMEDAARVQHQSFLFAATADCPVGIGFAIDQDYEKGLARTGAYRFCGEYNRAMLKRALADRSIQRVVLSARWTNWRIGEPGNPVEGAVDLRLRDRAGVAATPAANATVFARGFLRLVGELRAAGKQVVVVGPVPEPPFSVPERLLIERFGAVAPAKPITGAAYRERHRRILSFFGQLERSGAIQLIRPVEVLCVRDTCPIETGAGPTFFDQDHLSLSAARRTAPLYAPLFH